MRGQRLRQGPRALATEDDSDAPLDLLLDEEDLEAEDEPIEEIDEAPAPPIDPEAKDGLTNP